MLFSQISSKSPVSWRLLASCVNDSDEKSGSRSVTAAKKTCGKYLSLLTGTALRLSIRVISTRTRGTGRETKIGSRPIERHIKGGSCVVDKHKVPFEIPSRRRSIDAVQQGV